MVTGSVSNASCASRILQEADTKTGLDTQGFIWVNSCGTDNGEGASEG